MRSLIEVVTGAESKAHDAATIAAGVPSRALMGRAGAAAAGEIAQRYSHQLSRGVLVLAGPGNNGGDGWIIARALAAAGIDVRVYSPEDARSPDCVAERDASLSMAGQAGGYTGEGIVVDALLGTGSSGAARGALDDARSMLELARRRGATIVAVDLPSGLDATTGEENGAVRADLTISFGTIKRGQLISRGLCGDIVAVDIGLLRHPERSEGSASSSAETSSFASPMMTLVDGLWVRENIPPIAAESHKGSRKKLLVIGGAPGMAGAVILSARAALRGGIGMVKVRVHRDCVDAVHTAVPAAMVESWDAPPGNAWADALVIGPGLGRTDAAREILHASLKDGKRPVVLDADALNAFEGDIATLKPLLADRESLLTPHPLEMSRLVGHPIETVLANRFDIGAALIAQILVMNGAVDAEVTVLLKGVPTVLTNSDGERLVVAAGTPTLATAGSGDVLSGIAGTLLAQTGKAFHAGACAAWIHGRASELAGARVRGTTLDDVIDMLPNAWSIDASHPRYPVLAELRAVAQ